jgi:phosphoglycerate dehydrogenase-like enzyme
MQAIGCVARPPTPERRAALAQHGIRLTDFDEVITTADFVSVHVPFNASTRHLIDGEVLGRMKAGAYLINMARGGVVNERDLYTALTAGDRVRGAALDVHEQEGEGHVSALAALPNVILTPHIGTQAHETQREIGHCILEIVRSYQARGH